MGQYSLIVPYTYINQIRSNDADTLVASAGLRVMNAEGALHMDWPAHVASLGQFTSGRTVRIYLRYDNVDVPGPTAESADGGAIYWNFVLANAGHAAPASLISAITTAAGAVGAALLGTGNIVGIIVGGTIAGTAQLVQLLSGGCDGIVAAQNWALTDKELTAMVNKVPPSWVNDQNYPGTASPFYCGGPSNYGVTYQIASGGGIVVPNVVHMPWSDAANLLSSKGLTTYVTQYITSQQAEEATVAIQTPSPRTVLFAPLTEVDVVLIVPPSGGGHGGGGGGGHPNIAKSRKTHSKSTSGVKPRQSK